VTFEVILAHVLFTLGSYHGKLRSLDVSTTMVENCSFNLQLISVIFLFDSKSDTRGRGRPRKTIRETIRKDLKINELDKNMVYDRTLWRNLIHIANPT
jgi:hypothetical protein